MGFSLKMLLRGEVLLLLATLLALVLANSNLAPLYAATLHWQGGASWPLPLSLHDMINDGLMAIFFFHVGLEIKREALEGALDSWPKRALPALAALGGMLLPALLYALLNARTPAALRGWAIPTATDIAFALGVMAALAGRVPASLRSFLSALAILDDLGAILIIALFYGGAWQPAWLAAFLLLAMAFWALSRFWSAPWLIALAFLLLWVCAWQSGLHATLAGIALALGVPRHALARYEHALAPFVIYSIVPLFALANAGLDLSQTSSQALLGTVPLGIILGLFLGKQTGVFAFSALAIRLGLAPMPEATSWRQLYGAALLCGIGFTMSLFIAALAFPTDPQNLLGAKLAILLGSALSALAGYLVLRRTKP